MTRTIKWLLIVTIYIPSGLIGTLAVSAGTAFPAFADCISSYDLEESDEECDEPDEDAGWEHPGEAHDPQCLSAWELSTAKKSCSGLDWIERKDSECRLHVQCATGTAVYNEGDKSLRTLPKAQQGDFQLDDVKKLSNCSGSLKVGSC